MTDTAAGDELRALYGEPRDLVREAWAPRLDDASRRWLMSSTMVLIASVNGEGDIDITPRGGEPGFIHIQEDNKILILDQTGNNKIHTLRNLVSNPSVGMMFVIPGLGEVLRAYGAASVSTAADLIQVMGGTADKNKTVLSIHLRRIFPHCSKAFARAGMWDNRSWVDRAGSGVPGLSELAKGMAATRLDGG